MTTNNTNREEITKFKEMLDRLVLGVEPKEVDEWNPEILDLSKFSQVQVLQMTLSYFENFIPKAKIEGLIRRLELKHMKHAGDYQMRDYRSGLIDTLNGLKSMLKEGRMKQIDENVIRKIIEKHVIDFHV